MPGDVPVAAEAPPAVPGPAFNTQAGTPLDSNLNRLVPVSQTVPFVLDVAVALGVPVSLTVPVDIPLSQSELHTAFTGLANLMGSYDTLPAAASSSRSDLFWRQ
jgi:hypothetical protein